MLKLEKVTRSHEIILTMRNKESMFNNLLLKALAIALTLHLAGFLLFHIKILKIAELFEKTTPAMVNIDLSSVLHDSESRVLFQIEQERHQSHFSIPHVSTPDHINFVEPIIEKNIELVKNEGLLSSQIVESFDRSSSILNSPPSFIKHNPIKVHFSGDLAQLPLLEDPNEILKAVKKPNTHFEEYSVTYSAQVNNQSGKIFYLDQLSPRTNKDLDQLAENLAGQLRFAQTEHSHISVGTIEIMFLWGGDHP